MAQQLVIQILENHGIDHYGFSQAGTPLSINTYKEWLNQNLHGEMTYLKEHLEKKENPNLLLAEVQSAISVTVPYSIDSSQLNELKSLKIAKYAQGPDYHFWLKEKLELVVSDLRAHFPTEKFLVATDSMPILERDLAYKGGLGWFGKNSCLIDQKRGSYLLIGEILTSIELPSATDYHPDLCGTCSRCIEACPTNAILENRTIDAKKCISYLTIESRTIPDPSLREAMGDHFFGCDICQDVCPWNRKHKTSTLSAAVEIQSLVNSLDFVLSSSGKKLEKILCHTPLSRARPFGLKRNALIVIGNLRLADLRDRVSLYLGHPRLGELAGWTLSRL